MSMWTHITSCLSVDTCNCSKTPVEDVYKYLKKAPKITGSEADADVFVNLQSGHNFYTSHDCTDCEFAPTLHDVVIDGQEYSECDAPDDHDCSAEYQTCVVISIQGDLRDRMKDQTQKEFDAFLKYLEKKYMIRDYSLNIEGD